MSPYWLDRKRSYLKITTILGLAVGFLLLVSCGADDTAAPSPILLVTGNVSTNSDGVTERPPGAGQTPRDVPRGTTFEIVPRTEVAIPADVRAEAKVKMDIHQGAERTATTTCTLKRDTAVETLPNGPNDNLLLSMAVGKMGCNHVDTRFSRYRLNVIGAGTLTFRGTAVIIEFQAGKELMIGVAEGEISFDYLEGVAEGDQNPVIREGEALAVDLATKIQEIRLAEFSPEDIEILEGLEVEEVPPTSTESPTQTPPGEPTMAATPTPVPTATMVPTLPPTKTPTVTPVPTAPPTEAPTAFIPGISEEPAFYFEPTPYRGRADSFFDLLGAPELYYVEDFENNFIERGLPKGVDIFPGDVIPPGFGGLIDSVDEDDGVIDGSGLKGHSFFTGNGSEGITVSFDAEVLGFFPMWVGIVWTDGGGEITFEALNANGKPLGTVRLQNAPDGSNSGTTLEDHFFGIWADGGISAITIANSAGGIELDHLQFSPAPEQ